MNLKIEIGNITSRFLPPPHPAVIEAIRLELRYKIEGAQFARGGFHRYGSKPVEEYKYLYSKRTHSFPTGLLQKVEEILKEHNVEYTLVDTRPDYPVKTPLDLSKLKLRDYQLNTEQIALREKNGVIKIATGGGKTAIFTSLLGKLNGYNNIVFVRRQLLLIQTKKVLEEQLGITIGQIGAGVVDIQPTTVAMIPTVSRALDVKYVKVEEDDEDDSETNITEEQREKIRQYLIDCHSVTYDECHCLPAESAQQIAKHIPNARYRWGFSATPWRSDGRDILITAITGPRLVDIDASYLIERNFLVPPHIYFLKTPKPNLPLNKQGEYQTVYKNLVVQNKERNDLIVKTAADAYEKFEHILILVQQIEHGKLLLEQLEAQGVWAEYISGSSSILARGETIKRFQSRSRAVLIGSAVLDEGVDIPEITTLINAAGGKSSARYYQKIGRCIRAHEGKKRAIVVDFVDHDIKYMSKHAQSRIDIIRTEKLYKIKIQGGFDG